ncbi:filamentous hemagglutinin N-terminal domain-containing protein [Calothrix sp. PCC 6303]|uniref:two-partner secretion domain-containing protein n=1 Tax=Calothrix sp. PCC 6303 TaxID=1170562 RepID=UPI0002A043DD|nr:filamentous hemagglutinin N-terminal domain-containing protein [Calothrix sp. PCC 6303]AFY99173.1 filamentous hemagglutinin family outer membrane protein [Calothrix sp. PCC 6303]
MNRIQFIFSSLFLYIFLVFKITPVKAQITPDTTLGNESSQINYNAVINGLNADQINGGATRGSNLFHSFSEFNIKDGQRVYFANPSGVLNILTRVTGKDASSIFGTLGVDGNANLFLMNPNGILFGKNAQLDIQGSFLGTTANSITFPGGAEFSANNPQAVPLLTINLPIGLQFGSQPGNITSQAVIRDSQGNLASGLLVGGGTLAFMGGEITLDDSLLFAQNGQVKLGAISGDTTVGLNVNGSLLDFKFPENFGRAPINLTNANIFVTDENGAIELFGGKIGLNNSILFSDSNGSGSIIIDATLLNLDNGTRIFSATSGTAKGGDIQIQASGAVNFANSSRILSISDASATVPGGDVTINAEKITVTGDGNTQNSSSIGAFTYSEGNGGNITLNAKDSIHINGGLISASTDSTGKGGDLTVRATNDVNIANNASFGLLTTGSGSTGNIQIETGTLRLQNNLLGGGVTALASGSGSVGSISIQARNAVEVTQSNISTSLVIPLGSPTQATAGDITIQTQRLNLKDGGSVNTNTFSSANAANISIKASEYIEISGFLSEISSSTRFGSGNGGNVTIETPRFTATQGGGVSTTSLESRGNAGNITIRAKDVELDGSVFVPKEQFLARINQIGAAEFLFDPLSQEILARFGGLDYESSLSSDLIRGNADVGGGTITIDTERLRLSNGGKISTSVLAGGQGRGGNLVVRATDSIDITGVGTERLDGSLTPSGLFAELQTGGIGSGGSIDVTTRRLNLSNGGAISASTFGEGNAGNIRINARSIDLRGNSKIATQVDNKAKGNAGNINITTQLLNVQEESQISSATQGSGNAGNLTVQADNIILTGSDSKFATGFLSSVDEGANGNGGGIDITSNRLTVRKSAEIVSSSLGTGDAGNIGINANFVEILDKGSAIASSTNAGNGGDIKLNIADILLLRRGAFISTTAGRNQAGGDGGNINLISKFIVAVPQENSDILANAFTGRGGNINIQTQAIFGIEPRPQTTNQSDITASSELGVQGQISIQKPDADPSRGLIQLPGGFKDKSDEIDQLCGRNRIPLGSFIVTGKDGSIPSNPVVNPMQGEVDLSLPATLDESNSTERVDKLPDSLMVQHPPQNRIVEAQALMRGADGTLYLVAQAPNAIPNSRPAVSACTGVGRR